MFQATTRSAHEGTVAIEMTDIEVARVIVQHRGASLPTGKPFLDTMASPYEETVVGLLAFERRGEGEKVDASSPKR
jgi:hypothetical protein